MSYPQLAVVFVVQTLEFHAAQPHANPGVEFVKDFPPGKPTGGEVLSGSPNDSVEIHEDLSFAIM